MHAIVSQAPRKFFAVFTFGEQAFGGRAPQRDQARATVAPLRLGVGS